MSLEKTILFADDDETLRFAVNEYFENSTLIFDFAENGVVALDKSLSNTYDLIILDISMPFMNGNDAVKTIKAQKPDIPVLAYTGITDPDKIDQFIKDGFNKVVSKPLEFNQLEEIIKELLNPKPKEDLTVSLNVDTPNSSLNSNLDSKKPIIGYENNTIINNLRENITPPSEKPVIIEDNITQFSFSSLIDKPKDFLIQTIQKQEVEKKELLNKIKDLEAKINPDI